MLFGIDDSHKEHLSFLNQLEVSVVFEFCKISIEFIKNGTNPKVFQGAAKKLSVSADAVQQAVEGLMYLLCECGKLMLNETDFHEAIIDLGFTEDVLQTVQSFYLSNRSEIRSVLSDVSMTGLPHYQNLQWRMDVQLATRSLHHQITPQVVLLLETAKGEHSTTHLLQTDPVNLAHVTKVLEDALCQIKSPYCRRIFRHIK